MKNLRRNTDIKDGVKVGIALVVLLVFYTKLQFEMITFLVALISYIMFLVLPQVETYFEFNKSAIKSFQSFRWSYLNRNENSGNTKIEKETIKDKTSNQPWLDEVFSEMDVDMVNEAQTETISILSYFATSLFGKNNVDEVLWDIVENCIAHLQLEDCVIYMVDKKEKSLLQKAAFGNKNNGGKKVISPIKIKLGAGIVGNVAETGTYNCVDDLSGNLHYIVDDLPRRSELAVPICLENEVIGVLDSEHSEKGFFTQNHIFLFHLIAKLTSKKLQHIYTKNLCQKRITNDNIYFKELDFLMKEAKMYRDPNLGLESMAQKLKISSNYLSQLVNKLTGKNFTDYINGFRVEDAKEKLKNTSFIHYTIISIGLESGFNSKSTFYSAFKKVTGVSPSTYRKTN
ncbi:helix-turn-helix domain-containing protein [Aquimarina sp. D1M17]|uniref:helix-turn-helix domain-containing protein n=1 Tax=Aquimarina acroporae TaxID=2937283 RepID=UPI0020BEC937|nr:helix-turn-helix domain-containing protein [Aquimarina acroporae]MCK8523624.1 helix-turn-helix domain-containing protein [Aquimarina acroporae]